MTGYGPGAHGRRPRRRASGLTALALVALTAVTASACSTRSEATSGHSSGSSSGSSPAPGSSPATSPPPTADAEIQEVTDAQWQAMTAADVWRKGCPDVRDQLRRVETDYVDFDGRTRRGALVVNADVAPSVVRIFTRLYEERFPIRRMEPTEEFGGDVKASLRADNTSAFNCRRPDQINAPAKESPHANGRAIDINPLENPWKDLRCKCWTPSGENRARTPGQGKILKDGLVHRLFTAEGWVWQNIDVPDYMHFDTGYPSGPFGQASPRASAGASGSSAPAAGPG